MKMKSNPRYEVKIYIGSRRGYKGAPFDKGELTAYIWDVQDEAGPEQANPVRVSETTYLWAGPGEKYKEEGWEIAVIQYPRRPKPIQVINRFALNLAESLLKHFHQNRISVVFPDEIVMLEADDPEEHS
jgi:hypothetical protein